MILCSPHMVYAYYLWFTSWHRLTALIFDVDGWMAGQKTTVTPYALVFSDKLGDQREKILEYVKKQLLKYELSCELVKCKATSDAALIVTASFDCLAKQVFIAALRVYLYNNFEQACTKLWILCIPFCIVASCKGKALQYNYPVLWSSSSVKVKVKSQGRILGRVSILYSAYHDRYFYRQLCERNFTKIY